MREMCFIAVCSAIATILSAGVGYLVFYFTGNAIVASLLGLGTLAISAVGGVCCHAFCCTTNPPSLCPTTVYRVFAFGPSPPPLRDAPWFKVTGRETPTKATTSQIDTCTSNPRDTIASQNTA